jgi:hypothetical protein
MKGGKTMKLSKDELKQKVNELVTDNDIAIQLLEDIEDSFENGEIDRTEIDSLQAKFDDLQEKYKQRFLKGEEKKDTEEKEDEELEEKEIIDVKEI